MDVERRGEGAGMATGVFIVYWRSITSTQIPFPSSETLTGTQISPPNAATPIYLTNTAGRYLNNPAFAGITIWTNGLSGGNARTSICFSDEMVGRKIKVYFGFASLYYEYEVQVWGPGCWVMVNPGSGPATPNSITFGNPVDIFEDFDPNERDPAHPPPTYNPFIPWLVITIEQSVTACALSDVITVTLHPIPTVSIVRAAVYKDGVDTGATLAQLVAGVTYAEPGEYEVVVVYRYLGDGINPPSTVDETLARTFTISTAPFPLMQRASRVHGYVVPGDPLLFDTGVVDNGTIEYNTLNGEFTLRFCGDYFIKWFVVPQMDLAKDGVNFAIAVNGSTGLIGSSHAAISPAVGFTIVAVDGAPPKIQLVSVSDGTIFLSEVTQVTAGILIFKIGEEMPG